MGRKALFGITQAAQVDDPLDPCLPCSPREVNRRLPILPLEVLLRAQGVYEVIGRMDAGQGHAERFGVHHVAMDHLGRCGHAGPQAFRLPAHAAQAKAPLFK